MFVRSRIYKEQPLKFPSVCLCMQWSREVTSGSICSGDTLERGNGESGGVLPSLSAVLRISTAELIISALLLLK